MTFKSSIEQLAKDIAKKAGEAATPFPEAVDALKALAAVYAIYLKDKGKSEDEPDGFTMADAQATIEESAHGEAAVRSGRGRDRSSN